MPRRFVYDFNVKIRVWAEDENKACKDLDEFLNRDMKYIVVMRRRSSKVFEDVESLINIS